MHSNGYLEHTKMHFMTVQMVSELASKCIHMVSWKHFNAFRQHSTVPKMAFVSVGLAFQW